MIISYLWSEYTGNREGIIELLNFFLISLSSFFFHLSWMRSSNNLWIEIETTIILSLQSL